MDLSYAAGRVAAEQSPLGAFENIDAGYGVELKNRRIAVRDINVIEINGDRAFLAGTVRVGSDPANERAGRVDFVAHLNARHETGQPIGTERSRIYAGVRRHPAH